MATLNLAVTYLVVVRVEIHFEIMILEARLVAVVQAILVIHLVETLEILKSIRRCRRILWKSARGSNMGGFDGGQPGNNGMGGFDGNQPGETTVQMILAQEIWREIRMILEIITG